MPTTAHIAACEQHFKIILAAENRCDVQVVGDDLQVIVIKQGAGNGFGGGANIDEQRGVIGDLRGNGFGDALFLIAHLIRTHGIGGVFDAGIVGGAAVVTTQQVHFRQLIDVATDGLRGHDEQLRHFFDTDVAAFTDQLQDLLLTGWQIHFFSFGDRRPSCRRRVLPVSRKNPKR
jgi:hypothetical protein